MSAKPISSSTQKPISKERLKLWLKLLKASGLIEVEIRRRWRSECDWTLPRFDVMSALARNPDGLNMSEISKQLRVSNGNVTLVVDKLAKEGLALRIAIPDDRRANLVRLTSKGQKVPPSMPMRMSVGSTSCWAVDRCS